MNTLLAAGLFDNPWVVLVIVLVGALSNWLMKRRQRNQPGDLPEGDEPLPPGSAQERPAREINLQEVLRQMLEGKPPSGPPQPPPIPPLRRDAQPAGGWPDEEQFQPEQALVDEAQEGFEPLQPDLSPLRAHATRVEPGEPPEQLVPKFERLNEPASHPGTVVRTGHRHRLLGTGALVRDAGTVRQAFVASLVFGPPKAFESGPS